MPFITFLSHRQHRINEMMNSKSKKFRFGEVIEISRPDFVTEVTEASKSHFILVHLYQGGFASCQQVSNALRNLCKEYDQIKFVEIQSTRCIENYPDGLLPTILVYKDNNVYTQVTNTTPEQIKRILDTIQVHLDEIN